MQQASPYLKGLFHGQKCNIERIILPEDWTLNVLTCKKAGIPPMPAEVERVCKSKVELALDIIKRRKEYGTWFHFKGSDGMYGSSCHFQQEIDKLEILFVLDIHSDQYIYTEPPVKAIPDKTAAAGRKPTRDKATGNRIEVREWTKNITVEDMEKISLRKTGKGDLNCLDYSQKVYLWDGESSDYMERILLLRITDAKTEARNINMLSAMHGKENPPPKNSCGCNRNDTL